MMPEAHDKKKQTFVSWHCATLRHPAPCHKLLGRSFRWRHCRTVATTLRHIALQTPNTNCESKRERREVDASAKIPSADVFRTGKWKDRNKNERTTLEKLTLVKVLKRTEMKYIVDGYLQRGPKLPILNRRSCSFIDRSRENGNIRRCLIFPVNIRTAFQRSGESIGTNCRSYWYPPEIHTKCLFSSLWIKRGPSGSGANLPNWVFPSTRSSIEGEACQWPPVR